MDTASNCFETYLGAHLWRKDFL